MTIQFYKYQGAGNDFVIMDNRDHAYDALTKHQVAFLCHRRFGIGADGLMLLNNCNGYDFEMKYYNADGGESSMCGNGGRCLVKFAHDKGIHKDLYRFLAVDGEHEAGLKEDGLIALRMKDVDGIREDQGNFILNTGSPHFVHLAAGVMGLDVFSKGREIRYNREFEKEGINVNFVEQANPRGKIIVRTYERGVEDETLSCGTGVTAAALVCAYNNHGFNHVDVETRGGQLSVEYEKAGHMYKNIWLIGPALKVFEGSVKI